MKVVRGGSSMFGTVVKSGVPVSGLPACVVHGIVPTQSLWDGQTGFGYQAKTGGTVFTDFTTACNNATANDVTFFDATMQAQDAFYFGDTNIQFNQIKINLGTSGVYNATLVWEYWNGAWVTLTVSDLTTLLTAAPGTYYVTFTTPGDQAKTTVNGQNAYWVRLRVSAFTSKTTAPLGTQVWLGASPTSLSNATDGDRTTATGYGSVNLTAGSGFMGYIVFDMGAEKTVLVGGLFGAKSAAGNVLGYIHYSYDNITWQDQGQLAVGGSGATEHLTRLAPSIFTARYFRVAFFASAGTATADARLYEVMAYELSI